MSTDYGDHRLPERFWAKVYPEPNTGCWLWASAQNHRGYGLFRWNGKTAASAHRVSYSVLVNSIPDGLHLDHLCRVRWCVNPEHLEPVTHGENVRRGFWAKRTHCVSGHEYTEENTYYYPGTSTRRICRECHTIRQRAYTKRKNEHNG